MQVFIGEGATRFYQLVALKAALRLEIAGMRHSRGLSAFRSLKVLGFKARTRKEMLEVVSQEVERRIEEAGHAKD